jgi:maltose alpha-D-glucosyltransferase/alpha-amylase
MSYLRENAVLPFGEGQLHFSARPVLAEFDSALDEDINLAPTLSINGSVIIGEKMRLKPLRKLIAGIHPEVEMSSYLEARGFSNIAPVFGEVKRVDAQGDSYTLMILQGFISNQGDAWQWTQNTLQRALRDRLSAGTSSMDTQYPAIVELESFANLLGQRLGAMHLLLAQPNSDARFGALETSATETAEWVEGIVRRMAQALEIMRNQTIHNQTVHNQNGQGADWLVNRAEKINELINRLGAEARGGVRIRIHGNLHLAQVLVVAGDAWFVNFEDGAAQMLYPDPHPNTFHQSPLKDVADMLCSFNDAAAHAIRTAQTTDVLSNADEIHRLVTNYTSRASKVFYDAYFLAASELSQHWNKRASEEAALALFCLDNRAREIIKLEYRPDYLDVPVRDLTDLVRKYQQT